MTIDGWSLIRFVHVTCAIGWVGGQLLFSAVVVPALKANTEPQVGGPLIRAAAKRFTRISTMGLLPLLLITGLLQIEHRDAWSIIGEPGYGRLLLIKLILAALSVVLAVVHGILAAKKPTPARVVAVGGLGASLGVVVFATALVP